MYFIRVLRVPEQSIYYAPPAPCLGNKNGIGLCTPQGAEWHSKPPASARELNHVDNIVSEPYSLGTRPDRAELN